MSNISRRDALIAAGGSLLTAASAGLVGVAVQRKRPTNVIFIIADALRADRLGCYGYRCRTRGGSVDPTPNINRLAEEGTLFERCVSHSSWTVSSVAAKMYSAYPAVGGNFDSIAMPSPSRALAEVFRAAGYSTQAIVTNALLAADTPLGALTVRGFDRYDTRLTEMINNPLKAQGIGRDLVYDRNFYAGNVFPEAAGRISAANAQGRSVFMYLHLMDTHEPYNAVQPYLDECPAAPMNGIPDFMLMPFIRHFAHARHQMALTSQAAPFVRRLSALYDASVRYLDATMQDFMNRLAAQARRSNAIVVLTSDHGEEFGDHNWVGHAETLYYESVHVPLIMWGVGVPRGKRIENLIATLDIAPSLLALLGIAAPDTMIGNRVDLTSGETGRTHCVSALVKMPDWAKVMERAVALSYQSGLRLIHHEYVAGGGKPPLNELFDLRTDPHEKRDLFPSRAAAVSATVEQAHRFAEAYAAATGTAHKVDEETIKKMKALGYLGG